MNECCNEKVWLLWFALLYRIVIIHIDKKTFRYSEINTLCIKNTNVMGKVSTQLGSKHRYPSTHQSYSSSRKVIGGWKRKKQDATPKTSSTYFDKFVLLFSLLNFKKKKIFEIKLVSVINTVCSYIIALFNYFSLLSVDMPLKKGSVIFGHFV